MIPLVDLTRLSSRVKSSIDKEIKKIINKGDYVLGDKVQEFENQFAKYVGMKYGIGVASGTDAMLISLSALGIAKGDEVIVPAMTFIASASPILMLGAKPVFVDIKKDEPLIDPGKIEKAITNKTKAIIVVHLYGYACDLDKIKKIARKNNLFLIEDACQAHGSYYKNKKLGSFGDVSVFSFYPSKNLGGYGDGGMILTNNKSIINKSLLLRNHGEKNKYNHKVLGYNSRLDSIQAAVLSVKLSQLDKWNSARIKAAKLYKSYLGNFPIILPPVIKNSKPNYYLFVIKVKQRDKLRKFLKKKNISTGIHYPRPLHLEPVFKNLGYKFGNFPNAELHAKECLSLPIFPEITNKEVKFVSSQVKYFLNK